MSGRYVFTKGLRELRFHLCQQSEGSIATKNFLTRAYPTMKKNNPHTPILIREALGVEPKVWARYEYGKEQVKSLKDLNDKSIEATVSELAITSS